MKKLFTLCCAVFLFAAAIPAFASHLIVYFTRSGNSEKIATALDAIVGGDVIKIVPTTAYPTTTSEMKNTASTELDAIDNQGVYPSISTIVSNISSYDTLFLACPLWSSRMSTPMQAFLHNYASDLAGKTIALIITSSSKPLSGPLADANRILPQSNFTDGLLIKAANVSNSTTLITEWLKSIGYGTSGVDDLQKLISLKVIDSRLIVSGEFSSFTLYDMNGAEILRSSSQDTDISRLTVGMYIVNIKSGKYTFSKIFVKN